MCKVNTLLLAAVLAIAGALAGTALHAQQGINLQNLAPNTVVGRLGSGRPGPAQSIPLGTLNSLTASNYSTDVDTFGAKGDGTTDDAAAIQAAINSLPAGGGAVNFTPGKTYCVHSTVIAGNGTSSGLSTTNGIFLLGANGFGEPNNAGSTAPPIISGCFVNTANPLIEYKGVQGWGISGLTLDCTGAGTGLELLDTSYGISNNITTYRCATHVLLTSDAGGNTQWNIFNNLSMGLFGGINAVGLQLSGNVAASTNSSFNTFNNAGCNGDATKSDVCILLQDDDSNIFFYPGAANIGNVSGAAAIKFDYSTQSPNGPTGNVFMRPQFFSVNANHGWVNTGTPNLAPNYIYFPDITNGNAVPQLAGTEYTDAILPPGISLTAQTATVTSAQLNPSGPTLFPGGPYRACAQISVTTTGAGGATLGATLTWTDADTGTSQTQTIVTSGLATSGKNIGQGCVFMGNVNGGTNITSTVTVTGTIGAAQFAYHATLERMD